MKRVISPDFIFSCLLIKIFIVKEFGESLETEANLGSKRSYLLARGEIYQDHYPGQC